MGAVSLTKRQHSLIDLRLLVLGNRKATHNARLLWLTVLCLGVRVRVASLTRRPIMHQGLSLCTSFWNAHETMPPWKLCSLCGCFARFNVALAARLPCRCQAHLDPLME